MSWSRPVGASIERSGDADATDLKTRVAWLYFMEGLTQDAVALRLGLTRQRVLKILAAARQDGTVQIRVTTRLTNCVALERRLEAGFGIERAIVIPSPGEPQQLTALLGAVVGAYVSEALQDGMTIGLGWGATLQSSLTSMIARPMRDVTAVSLLGGLTRASGVNPAEFAWRFADLVGAESFLLTAPVFLPDEATRDTLRRHPGIVEVLARAARLDMALLSVGDISPSSTMMRYGLITRDELAEVTRAGAVADVLCQFVDAQGQVLDHPINRRVLAADPASLRGTPGLVLVSGGWAKVPSLLAAIRLLAPRVLITDEIAAEGLLRLTETEA
ncbi:MULTISPECIES: sugar-binding transcriptional regulator [Acidiphilium]|uniref:DNA-binding transcriptional regulator LsrR, DeoR family n=1 Tax=Acidiphilium rubrum TaxID=526 RepID=A0A8G2CK48_ACIRU|nr:MULTISPECIES: sugar-binding transcriptional regulator [Acidiphilium]SIQ69065.1 DNA-binding transcriptional regulator LsrR, DeoR family [Acidiphilium rubrum]